LEKEKNFQGQRKNSLLSDAFEALIGALYIVVGLETAKAFVYQYMDKNIKCVLKKTVL
jgi:ribonuclease-3